MSQQSFIQYHDCDKLYKDGTRQLVKHSCSKPTSYPFWKDIKDVTNKVAQSTRGQLKLKPVASQSEILSYRNRIISDTNTNIVEFKPVIIRPELTGDNLIIDERIPETETKQQTTNNKLIPEIHSL